eukprot:345274-Pleurochrysis_carterae.AAC.1
MFRSSWDVEREEKDPFKLWQVGSRSNADSRSRACTPETDFPNHWERPIEWSNRMFCRSGGGQGANPNAAWGPRARARGDRARTLARVFASHARVRTPFVTSVCKRACSRSFASGWRRLDVPAAET